MIEYFATQCQRVFDKFTSFTPLWVFLLCDYNACYFFGNIVRKGLFYIISNNIHVYLLVTELFIMN